MTAEKQGVRKPDFILSVKVKDTTSTRRCGVAWKNPDGSISIKLDPCTEISWRDNGFLRDPGAVLRRAAEEGRHRFMISCPREKLGDE